MLSPATENGEGPVERETTLVVCSERPDSVYLAIAGISEIPGVLLGNAEKAVIRDVYLDTPGQELGKILWALRIRETGSKKLITLKGPSILGDGGAVERREIEYAWSDEGAAPVLAQLARLGVELHRDHADIKSVPPLPFMQRMGLRIIQHRETSRLLRKALACDGDRSNPDAELAVDAVTYGLGRVAVVHHEVEMEAFTLRGLELAALMAADLAERFGESLKPWPYGKLATGRALEELERQGSLDVHVEGGLLLPSAYDAIEDLLKR